KRYDIGSGDLRTLAQNADVEARWYLDDALSGDYELTVEAAAQGCPLTTDNAIITVNLPPSVLDLFVLRCLEDSDAIQVDIGAEVYDQEGDALAFEWFPGDGSGSVLTDTPSFSHAYAAEADFAKVAVRVTDARGAQTFFGGKIDLH